jgi:hypothetical protein
MRATLEQLKAMSDAELIHHWMEGLFPFENSPICGMCMTEHTYSGSLKCRDHENLFDEATMVLGKDFYPPVNMKKFRENLEKLYALRLFFSPYYKETADAVEETVQEEKVSV